MSSLSRLGRPRPAARPSADDSGATWIAANTFQITRRDVLTGIGNTIAVLADGEATLAGTVQRWSTVGLYRTADGRVAECWLMPTDPELFDQIWSP